MAEFSCKRNGAVVADLPGREARSWRRDEGAGLQGGHWWDGRYFGFGGSRTSGGKWIRLSHLCAGED